MVIHCESRKVTLAAASINTLIYEHTVQEGFVITILEKAFVIPDDGHIDGFLDEVKVDELEGKGYPTIADRAVVNMKMVAGQFWRFTGGSVGGGDALVLLLFDKVKI